mmetsp:Transcript_3626/g.11357  ORF Transcript_3626/g.11357 Transcript_3626/m.11357 type:complete len:282 (-) Transcript_3626:34-879(-)
MENTPGLGWVEMGHEVPRARALVTRHSAMLPVSSAIDIGGHSASAARSTRGAKEPCALAPNRTPSASAEQLPLAAPSHWYGRPAPRRSVVIVVEERHDAGDGGRHLGGLGLLLRAALVLLHRARLVALLLDRLALPLHLHRHDGRRVLLVHDDEKPPHVVVRQGVKERCGLRLVRRAGERRRLRRGRLALLRRHAVLLQVLREPAGGRRRRVPRGRPPCHLARGLGRVGVAGALDHVLLRRRLLVVLALRRLHACVARRLQRPLLPRRLRRRPGPLIRHPV